MRVVARTSWRLSLKPRRGREGHSSAPSRGANAVMMAGEFIASLAALERADDGHRRAFRTAFTTIQANMVWEVPR